MELRPYQQNLIDKIKQSILQGNKRICAVLGCGGGKSVIQGTIAAGATRKKNRVLFIVHRKELCQQIKETFSMCGVDFEYCHIGMVQTVSRRLDKIETPELILVDECHHILSSSYLSIVEKFPKAIVIGFTATPIRMNEGGLGSIFQDLVVGVSTRWLIAHHHLADYRYYGVPLVDTKKLHTKNGDYDKDEVEKLMNNYSVFGSAVDNWLMYAKGTQTIVYCSSINTSKATSNMFINRGISSAHLDGTTPKVMREHIVDYFRKGVIQVLCNVDLFGEGFDIPDCTTTVLLRPTKSLSLHIQQSMRSMRYKKEKVAIILDHVNGYQKHGLPDEVRYWSLEAKSKKEKTTITVRQCPQCFSVMPSNVKVCPYCNTELVVQRNGDSSQKVLDEIMLEEISKKDWQAYKECKTFDEVKMFAKAKHYRFPWVMRTCRELNIEIPKKYNGYLYFLGKYGGIR